jgi:hypothetical protein
MNYSIMGWLAVGLLAAGLGLQAGMMPQRQSQSVTPALYFDENCQRTQPTTPRSADQLYRLEQAFPMQIQGKTHQFFRVRYFDMDLLCVGDADHTNAQRLDQAELKDFIEQMWPDPQRPNTFIVRLREGNGMTVPIRHISLAFQDGTTPTITNLNVLQQRVVTPTQSPREHRFRGKKGQSFTIDLDSRINQTMRPHMILLNSFGSTFAEGHPEPDFPGISHITVTLPIEGEYTIVVSNLSGPGSYMLSVNANQR